MHLHHLVSSTLLASLLAAGCSRTESAAIGAPAQPPPATAPDGPHEVRVFAAASLRLPFTELAKAYETDHPGAKVVLTLAGSAKLLEMLNAGEACDVVALGDSSVMSRVAGGGHLAVGRGSTAELTRSHLAIAVRRGNPKQVHAVADLLRADVAVALGTRSSSIGRYGRWVISRTGKEVIAKAEADTADAVLAKVQQGEADAAVVYTTSFQGADDSVDRVDLPAADDYPVLYSIAVTRLAKEPRGGLAFYNLALGPRGREALQRAGFSAPK